MDIHTLEQLTTVDERLKLFTPPEDYTEGQSFPEVAVRVNQEPIASADLAPDVPEAVREYFELCKKLHIHGCFVYEFFTLAADRTLFALELALKERFLEEYGRAIPLVQRETGHRVTVTIRDYHDFTEQFGQKRTMPYQHRDRNSSKGWDVEGHPNFDGSLHSLFEWARTAGLIPDALPPIWDEASRDLRNYVAHPRGKHLLMPFDSARFIRDTAEYINRLWGHDTPAGRLFYEPMTKLIYVCREDGGGLARAGDARLLARAPWVGCDGEWWIVEAANDSHALDWSSGLREGISEDMGVKVHAGPGTREEAVAAVDKLLRSGWQQRPVRDLLP